MLNLLKVNKPPLHPVKIEGYFLETKYFINLLQFIAVYIKTQEKEKLEKFKTIRREYLKVGDDDNYRRVIADSMRFEE